MRVSQPEAMPPQTDPETWVDRHGDYLFRYAVSRLGEPGAAEEVVQDTFLSAIRKIDQLRDQNLERTWLTAILKRRIIDYIRSRKRKMLAWGDDPDPTAALFDERGQFRPGWLAQAEPDTGRIEAAELWEIVRKCLTHLPQSQADVFVLSVMEDLSYEEVCKELEISTSNMWVRLHRARLSLAKCVGSKWFNDGEANGQD